MGKIGQVAIVTVMTGVVYLIMLIVMPFLMDTAATANATMQASSNMSNYPGAAEAPFVGVLVLWYVPALLWGVMVVGILKRK